MMLAPGDDFVEIVARSDGGAGQQQQDLGQRIDDPPGLAVVREPREMAQQKSHPRPGTSSSAKKSAASSMWRPLPIRGAERIIPPRQGQIGVNLTSQPWGFGHHGLHFCAF